MQLMPETNVQRLHEAQADQNRRLTCQQLLLAVVAAEAGEQF